MELKDGYFPSSNGSDFTSLAKLQRFSPISVSFNVLICFDSKYETEVSVKKHQLSDETNLLVETLSSNHHLKNCEYLLPIYECIPDDVDSYFTISPYCKEGDLEEWIRRNEFSLQKPIPPETILLILYQVGIGIDTLHHSNIIHRDLKLKNIFVREYDPNTGYIKIMIGDFGDAKQMEKSYYESSGTKTFNDSPPEIIDQWKQNKKDVKWTKKADLWGIGCVLFRLLTFDLTSPLHDIIFDDANDNWIVNLCNRFQLDDLFVKLLYYTLQPIYSQRGGSASFLERVLLVLTQKGCHIRDEKSGLINGISKAFNENTTELIKQQTLDISTFMGMREDYLRKLAISIIDNDLEILEEVPHALEKGDSFYQQKLIIMLTTNDLKDEKGMEDIFEKSIQLFPKCIYLSKLSCSLFFMLEKYEKSLLYIEKVTCNSVFKLNYEDWITCYDMKSNIYAIQEKWDEALSIAEFILLELAVRKSNCIPKHVIALNRAELYFNKKDYDQCIESCTFVIDTFENLHSVEDEKNAHLVAYTLAAKAYGEKGDQYNCFRFIQVAHSTNERDCTILIIRAQLYIKFNQIESALDSILKAISIQPQTREYYELALTVFKMCKNVNMTTLCSELITKLDNRKEITNSDLSLLLKLETKSTIETIKQDSSHNTVSPLNAIVKTKITLSTLRGTTVKVECTDIEGIIKECRHKLLNDKLEIIVNMKEKTRIDYIEDLDPSINYTILTVEEFKDLDAKQPPSNTNSILLSSMAALSFLAAATSYLFIVRK